MNEWMSELTNFLKGTFTLEPDLCQCTSSPTDSLLADSPCTICLPANHLAVHPTSQALPTEHQFSLSQAWSFLRTPKCHWPFLMCKWSRERPLLQSSSISMKAEVSAAVFDLFQGCAREPPLATWNAQSCPWGMKMAPFRLIITEGTHRCRLLNDPLCRHDSGRRMAGLRGFLAC